MSASNGGNPTTPSFKRGEKVEVKVSEPGFDGAWFEVEVVCDGTRRDSLVVRNVHFSERPMCYTFLNKVVDASSVRPRPLPAQPEEFRHGDAAEVFHDNGWRACKVVKMLESSESFSVIFPDGGMVDDITEEDIRRPLDWVDGEWLEPARPSVSEKVSPKSVTATKKASEPTLQTARKRGRPPRGTKRFKPRHSSSHEGREETGGGLQSNGGEPAAKINESRSVSSNRVAEELASQNDAMELENHVCSLGSSEMSGQPLMNYSAHVKITLRSVWDALLALDVFQAMPQRPHFRSLEQLEDEHREGIALGHMAIFAKFAESLRKLGLEDSSDVLAKKLDALKEFEQHGFDVEILRRRLKNLIERKRMLEDVSQEKALIESEITQNAKKRSESVCLVDEINRKLKELADKKLEVMETIEECKRINSELVTKILLLQDESDDLRDGFRSDWNFEQ